MNYMPEIIMIIMTIIITIIIPTSYQQIYPQVFPLDYFPNENSHEGLLFKNKF